MIGVGAADHFHVDAGAGGLESRIPKIGGEPVIDQLLDGNPVADHEAIERPFIAENLLHQEAVAACGHAVKVTERRHQADDSRVDRRLERRQVDIAQFVFRDIRGVVVAPGLAGPVTGKVLGAGGDGSHGGQVIALEAFDHGDRQPAGEIRILAETLGNPTPAGIARDIDHRREGPVDAHGGGFERGDSRTALDEFRVPGGGLAKRYGQYGSEPMDDIAGQQQWNAQAALLGGDSLQFVGRIDIDHIEYGADFAGRDRATQVLRNTAGSVDLNHLADLFLQGHLSYEFGNPCLGRVIGERCLCAYRTRRCVHKIDSHEEARGQSACRGVCKAVSVHP